MTRARCILFDLDGTLLDTLPDLAFALNTVLAEEGLEPLPLQLIRPAISHGAQALLRLGFGEVQDQAAADRRVARLLAVYQRHLAANTKLFDGMAEVLETIESQGKVWGVVTSKRRYLTLPLLERLGLRQRVACVVCGDDTLYGKPHPDPLWLACRMARVEPAECLYMGDARSDIEAGRRAGMRTLVARYGYLAPDARPELWGADAVVDKPEQLVHLLRDGLAASAEPW
ncbi:MAG: HAD family hydrolase, partial [Methylohalobius sp.]